jgi:glycerol-3-phosphate dehydrogenase (NAD(P)+)
MRSKDITKDSFNYLTPDIKIAGIGLGPFGLANYKHLSQMGYKIKAYDKDKNIIKHMQKTGKHPYHFRNLHAGERVNPVSSLEEAVSGAELIILAVDSQNVRSAVRNMKEYIKPGAVILNLAKGLELGEKNNTGKAKFLSEVEKEELGQNSLSESDGFHLAAGAGGVFAVDLMFEANTYMTMASSNIRIANDLSKLFRSKKYHTQACDDIRGVELAGAIKNVIAIEKGIGDEIRKKYSTFMGVELRHLPFAELLAEKNNRFKIEHSSLCGFISAYMNEMVDLAVELGAKRETFSIGTYACGGDMMTTCFSDESRNIQFGRMIAKESRKRNGKTPEEIYLEMKKNRKTVEGFPATKAFYEMAEEINRMRAARGDSKRVYALIDQSYKVLFKNKDPEKGIECLARYASLI